MSQATVLEIPPDFRVIPTPLPPMLAALVGHHGVSPWFSLCYQASKATWSTGWASGTCSYYEAYRPLIEHPLLKPWLRGAQLGDDDTPPRDALLCDRQTERMYWGDYEAVERFLWQANPPPTGQTLQTIAARYLTEKPPTLAELQGQGLFEFLGSPGAVHQQRSEALVTWLDQRITAELLAVVQVDAEAGDPYAHWLHGALAARVAQLSQVDTAARE